MSTILERIKMICDTNDVTITSLETIIGASKGVLSRALANNTDIQSKWLIKIVENYPLVNTSWLLTGVGEMLLSKNKSVQNDFHQNLLKEKPVKYVADKGIPLIPIDAMAGIGTGDMSILDLECERYVIPEFSRADYLIRVAGSSMYPKYNSGDIVACKRLTMTDIFFQWNKVYVLDTVQGAIIKRVHPGRDEEHIELISENEKYKPVQLHTSKINAIALVIGVIRLE